MFSFENKSISPNPEENVGCKKRSSLKMIHKKSRNGKIRVWNDY